MQIQDSVRSDLMPLAQASTKAMLEAKRSDSLPKAGDDSAGALRRKAFGEMGRALGLDFADVGSALRAMVARASGRERDAAGSVMSALDAALSQAGKALRKAGFSDAQVDKALAGVREELGVAAKASAELTSAQSTTYVRKDKASLAITTQEGDQVQIRFRNKEGVVSQTATSASGEERRVYAFSAGRIEIAVQGELNDEELAAITELVDKVESLAADFFAGDVQKAFEAASTLGFDAEQIAGFALKLSTRESLRQQSIGNPLEALPAKPAALPKAPVAAPIVAPAEIVPTDATGSPAAQVDGAAVAPVPTDAAAAAPGATETSTGADQVRETLGSYLRNLLGSLQQPAAAGRFEFSMQWKLEVVVAAVEAKSPTDKPTPGTMLLSGTLQELAKGVAVEPTEGSALKPAAQQTAPVAAA
jgi:hypothetical protein